MPTNPGGHFSLASLKEFFLLYLSEQVTHVGGEEGRIQIPVWLPRPRACIPCQNCFCRVADVHPASRQAEVPLLPIRALLTTSCCL